MLRYSSQKHIGKHDWEGSGSPSMTIGMEFWPSQYLEETMIYPEHCQYQDKSEAAKGITHIHVSITRTHVSKHIPMYL